METKSKNSTSNLLGKLLKTSNIEQFIRTNDDNMQLPSFHLYISQKCKEIGLLPERVLARADIESSYGHQIFKGSRMPSRDKVIQLAFGFGFSLDEAQALLKIAQYSPLYPKIKREAVLIFCLEHKRGMIETQALLHELGLNLLGGERE